VHPPDGQVHSPMLISVMVPSMPFIAVMN